MVERALPTLSVVVNNYNYAPYLAAALDAALAQLRDGDELVVVDDGSTDGSRAVLEGYQGRADVKLICQENQGQLAAVLHGIAAARNEVIALLDSDDEYLPGYLDRLRRTAAAQPQADFFFSRARPEGPDQRAVAAMARSLARMQYAEGLTGSNGCAAVMFGEYLGAPTSGLAFRAALVPGLLDACGRLPGQLPMNPHWKRFLGVPRHLSHHDRLFADGAIVRLAAALGARKYSIAEEGFSYRIHGSNAFATLPWRARVYLRFQRIQLMAKVVAEAAERPRRQRLVDLVDEARRRATPLSARRRSVLACQYALAALFTRGALLKRLLALPRVAIAVLRFRPAEFPPKA